MKTYRITSKSPEQIDAEFESAFKALKFRAVAGPTEADWLAPYRKAIMRQRKRGASWKQIAEIMCQPPINEKVTEQLLKKVFARKQASAAEGVASATASPKGAPALPPDDRYVLDPLTGRQIPPSELPR
jgi:hypothetical protein